jgi:hypothetical protein
MTRCSAGFVSQLWEPFKNVLQAVERLFPGLHRISFNYRIFADIPEEDWFCSRTSSSSMAGHAHDLNSSLGSVHDNKTLLGSEHGGGPMGSPGDARLGRIPQNVQISASTVRSGTHLESPMAGARGSGAKESRRSSLRRERRRLPDRAGSPVNDFQRTISAEEAEVCNELVAIVDQPCRGFCTFPKPRLVDIGNENREGV